MKVKCNDRWLTFEPVALYFSEDVYENTFSKKDNKTVEQTLKHNRYRKFYKQVKSKYSTYLDWNLGSFLLELKSNGDRFYLKFLNKYGDMEYGMFYIDDLRYINKRGLYLYSIGGDIKYFGRSRDSFKKRINQGYGKIHPKNCYIDGQSTNCHLNYLITKNKEEVKLFVCVMENEDKIAQAETKLIQRYKPPWNVALNG